MQAPTGQDEVVLSGYLLKKSAAATGWHERFFVLTRTRILYYDSHETLHKCRGVLDLNPSCVVRPSTSAPNAIKVNCDGKSLPLAANSPEEINRWKDAIEFVVSTMSSAMSGTGDALGVISVLADRSVRTTEIAGIEFTIDPYYDDFHPIGYGSYGVVCKAIDLRTGTEIAIKKVAPVFRDLIDTRRLLREIRVLRTLSHPCIIRILDLVPSVNTVDFSDLYVRTSLTRVGASVPAMCPTCACGASVSLWCLTLSFSSPNR